MREFRSLAEIISEHGGLIQTGPFGSQLHQHEYAEFGVPVVMPKDIVAGGIDEGTVARVTDQKADQLSRHALKVGDIVFPRRGEISKCALISEAQAGFLCGTGCLKIELPQSMMLPKFVRYYLGLPHIVEWLERNAVGTTMLNLNTRILGGVRVPIISLAEQRYIADRISAYDDLIENNRRRIALLEQSARLLYREWFVHLRFPGHEHVKVVDGVPERWERKPLKEIATLNYGKALKEELRQPGPYPVYGSSGIVGSHVTGLTSGPGIIVGRKGNVGSVYWSPVAFFAIDTVYYISVEQSSLYLYYALQDAQFISTDVAVPGLNREFAYSRQLLVPADDVLSEFLEAVMPFHQQIEKLTMLSEKLREARDLLLPRLMSGELAV